MPEKIRKHKQISQLEHVKRKSMWVGSQKIGETELYCLECNSESKDDMECKENKSMKLTKLKFAPAWYKILDEIIVNAIDQWVNFVKNQILEENIESALNNDPQTQMVNLNNQLQIFDTDTQKDFAEAWSKINKEFKVKTNLENLCPKGKDF